MFSIAPLGCQEECGSVFAQRRMNDLMAEKQERIKRSVKVLARLLLMNEAFGIKLRELINPGRHIVTNPISRDGRSFCRQTSIGFTRWAFHIAININTAL